MSSPDAHRSVSRGRSRTPSNIKPADDAPMADVANGARDDHSRSRTPSRTPSHSRSRSHSHRDRSRSRSLTRSPSHSRSRSPSVPQSAKIVIEKLTKNVNEAHLREIFSTYGDIKDFEMPMNRQFMMNKGIAYILYTSPSYAESAIAHMHEAQLDGALINVSIVLPRRRFSVSPPAKRPPPNRFGEPHSMRGGPPMRGGDRAFGGRPPPRASPGYGGRGGRRSPPPGYGRGRGGGGGYRDRYDDRDNTYRPRSYSPSRSPSPPRRRRSPSYDSRSRSPRRSPPPRRRDSPPRGGGRRRRSASYSSYGSRTPSVDRSRGGGGGRRR